MCRVPTVVVAAEASCHRLYDHLTAEFLRDAGVPTEHVYLSDVGIYGNGHLMAIEKNNDQTARFMDGKLREIWQKSTAQAEQLQDGMNS
jgi:S-ribosylhomocysteine lyase LuxS involved in autoinducer biosynthesis